MGINISGKDRYSKFGFNKLITEFDLKQLIV